METIKSITLVSSEDVTAEQSKSNAESGDVPMYGSAFIPNKGYETLSEALNDLQKRGFTFDFNFDNNCIFCAENKARLNPEDFEIVEYYRFEGDSDPADNAIVYAIKSDKHNMKGVLVSAYGAYSEQVSDDLISKFKIS